MSNPANRARARRRARLGGFSSPRETRQLERVVLSVDIPEGCDWADSAIIVAVSALNAMENVSFLPNGDAVLESFDPLDFARNLFRRINDVPVEWDENGDVKPPEAFATSEGNVIRLAGPYGANWLEVVVTYTNDEDGGITLNPSSGRRISFI